MPRRSPPAPSAAVVFRGGVHIAGTVIYCDAPRARALTFVSHAGVRTRGAQGQVLSTPRTRALLDASGRAAAGDEAHLVTPYGRPFSLGATRLEVYPSGHLPGAASLVVTVDGRRVAYGGEVNPGGGSRLAETCEVRGADVLVLAAPLAALGRPLPPRPEAEALLVAAVRRALDDGALPVVLAPAVGAAEEALCVLDAAGIPLRLHRTIARLAEAYRAMGVAVPRPAPSSAPHALLWPLSSRTSPALVRLGATRPLRRIAVTGQALDPSAAARLGVDEAIPLADHADLDALVAYVRATAAREVYVTAGYGDTLTRALAATGVRALPLGPPRQMDLL